MGRFPDCSGHCSYLRRWLGVLRSFCSIGQAESTPTGRRAVAWCREVRKAEEERRHVKAVAMNKQGKVGEHARKGTDLAGHLEHGRTPDQVSAVFHGKFWWRHDQILTQLAAGVEAGKKEAETNFLRVPALSTFSGQWRGAAAEMRSKGALATATCQQHMHSFALKIAVCSLAMEPAGVILKV
ncbi:hypothetical protein N1851_023796 [Merluccius polli]|uniref:Uncharacterized protein n=1 Tax=Merluccius polli TaxID=89951 RepID=A0AA47NXD7_MERPO|nr:hypothetical protein N1851_023796 [Merluccius polli]